MPILTEQTIYRSALLWLHEHVAPLRKRSMILEGLMSPGLLKCIFMAGGSASGKSFVAADLFGFEFDPDQLKFAGLKTVDSDRTFAYMLAKNGIDPSQMADIEKNDPAKWDMMQKGPNSIRELSKTITDKQKAFYQEGRLGIIIDGTGKNYEKIAKQKNEAEKLGYDCYMVYVYTSLEVAKARNAARAQNTPGPKSRVGSETLLRAVWEGAQANRGRFKSLFGGNYVDVDNSNPGRVSSAIRQAVNGFIYKPITNPIGREWLQMATAFQMLSGGHYR